jgi:[pyruvate, water dikinase]-phosphate phosphotransferase / [pyruvate, water dikinase] kinase
MKIFNLHLVSDSTGDTLRNIARAVLVQFEEVFAKEHDWPMIRSQAKIGKVMQAIQKNPGVVMYTIVNKEIRDDLKACCKKLNIPCIPVLSRAITDISHYLGVPATPVIGKQYDLNADYFKKIEAMNFTIQHDDGQSMDSLEQADIILVGVSRTSKSPTCLYLSYRGYKAANVPFVLDSLLLQQLKSLRKPFIVGLSISAARLIEIRKSRLLSIANKENFLYANEEYIMQELLAAKKLFNNNHWPIIDVTRKSVEEVAASIIYYYNQQK